MTLFCFAEHDFINFSNWLSTDRVLDSEASYSSLNIPLKKKRGRCNVIIFVSEVSSLMFLLPLESMDVNQYPETSYVSVHVAP